MKILLSNEEANLIDEITRRLKIDFAVVKNIAIYDYEMSCFLTLQTGLSQVGEALDCDDNIVTKEERDKLESIYNAVSQIDEEPFSQEELKVLEFEIDNELPNLTPCPSCGNHPTLEYACGEYFIQGTHNCPYCDNAGISMSSSKEKVIKEWNDLTQKIKCPLGGDETNDCADCAESGDYHFVNGECVKRNNN